MKWQAACSPVVGNGMVSRCRLIEPSGSCGWLGPGPGGGSCLNAWSGTVLNGSSSSLGVTLHRSFWLR